MEIQLSDLNLTYLLAWYGTCETQEEFDLTTIAEHIESVSMFAADNATFKEYNPTNDTSDFTSLVPGHIYSLTFKQTEFQSIVSIPHLITTNHLSDSSLRVVEFCESTPTPSPTLHTPSPVIDGGPGDIGDGYGDGAGSITPTPVGDIVSTPSPVVNHSCCPVGQRHTLDSGVKKITNYDNTSFVSQHDGVICWKELSADMVDGTEVLYYVSFESALDKVDLEVLVQTSQPIYDDVVFEFPNGECYIGNLAEMTPTLNRFTSSSNTDPIDAGPNTDLTPTPGSVTFYTPIPATPSPYIPPMNTPTPVISDPNERMPTFYTPIPATPSPYIPYVPPMNTPTPVISDPNELPPTFYTPIPATPESYIPPVPPMNTPTPVISDPNDPNYDDSMPDGVYSDSDYDAVNQAVPNEVIPNADNLDPLNTEIPDVIYDPNINGFVSVDDIINSNDNVDNDGDNDEYLDFEKPANEEIVDEFVPPMNDPIVDDATMYGDEVGTDPVDEFVPPMNDPIVDDATVYGDSDGVTFEDITLQSTDQSFDSAETQLLDAPDFNPQFTELRTDESNENGDTPTFRSI